MRKQKKAKYSSPSIKHYVWEENGKRYSSWKIDVGSSIVNCGDGGMLLFEEALRREAKKLNKKYEQQKTKK